MGLADSLPILVKMATWAKSSGDGFAPAFDNRFIESFETCLATFALFAIYSAKSLSSVANNVPNNPIDDFLSGAGRVLIELTASRIF